MLFDRAAVGWHLRCRSLTAVRTAGSTAACWDRPERLVFSQRLHCFVSATPPVFPSRVMRTLQSEHDIRIFHLLVRQYWKMKLSVSDPMAKPRDTQSRYISFGPANFHYSPLFKVRRQISKLSILCIGEAIAVGRAVGRRAAMAPALFAKRLLAPRTSQRLLISRIYRPAPRPLRITASSARHVGPSRTAWPDEHY